MRKMLLGTMLLLASVSLLACSSDDGDEDGEDATPQTTATTQATAEVTTTATTEATATSTSAATSTTEATSTEAAPTEAAGGGDEVRTEIARFAFETPIEISVGTSVTWTNTDEPHTVTARDGSFDSDRIPQGESFTHTFTEAGTFEYFCQIHPAMEGTVIVE